MRKNDVEYNPYKGYRIVVGESAYVYPLNHPSPTVTNSTVVATSPVVSYNASTGVFETKNTIYTPIRK